MAIAFVNAANSGLVCNTTTGTVTMSLTAGNVVFVHAISDSDITAVTDSAGNTYTKLHETSLTGWGFVDIWAALVTTGGGSVTITVTKGGPGASDCVVVEACQYSGFGDIAPAKTASGESSTEISGVITSSSFTPSPGASLIVASLLADKNASWIYSAGTNYTLRGPSNDNYLSQEDRIAPPSGSQTASFNITAGHGFGILAVAVQGRHDLSSGTSAFTWGVAGTPAVESAKELSGVVPAVWAGAGAIEVDQLLTGVTACSWGAAGQITLDQDLSGSTDQVWGADGILGVELLVNIEGAVSLTYGVNGKPISEGPPMMWAVSLSGPWMHRIR